MRPAATPYHFLEARLTKILPSNAYISTPFFRKQCFSLKYVCINVYSCAYSTTLNRLKLKQKEAIRIISNAGYRDHTNPLFKQSGILPLENLVKYSNLKFMHKYTHNKLPFSFSETWITNRARNPNLELRNVDDLYIPPHHFSTTKRFPLFSFPRIWNEEPVTKFNPSLRVYLKSVKSAMFNY